MTGRTPRRPRTREQRLQELTLAYQLDFPDLTLAELRAKAVALFPELESLRLSWKNSQRRFYSHIELVDFEEPA